MSETVFIREHLPLSRGFVKGGVMHARVTSQSFQCQLSKPLNRIAPFRRASQHLTADLATRCVAFICSWIGDISKAEGTGRDFMSLAGGGRLDPLPDPSDRRG